jgi:predicted lipid-binding transport protein (Tim44 family)
MQLVKISHAEDVRRFQIPLQSTYEVLQDTIKTTFPKLASDFIVKYTDDEGDVITIANTIELKEALKLNEGAVLKMNVVSAPQAQARPQAQPARSAHQAVPQVAFQAVPHATPQATSQAVHQAVPQPGTNAACSVDFARWSCGPTYQTSSSGSTCGPCPGFRFLKLLGFLFLAKFVLFSNCCCCPLLLLPLLFCFGRKIFMAHSKISDQTCSPNASTPSPPAQPQHSAPDASTSPQPTPHPSAPPLESEGSPATKVYPTVLPLTTEKQQLLNNLGFADAALNAHLLEAYGGDLQAVVRHLFRSN